MGMSALRRTIQVPATGALKTKKSSALLVVGAQRAENFVVELTKVLPYPVPSAWDNG